MAYAADLTALQKANEIKPDEVAFDESKGVAGRVNSLTSSASPLMETARTRAAQNSASRGLMNSSIGVQAGEQAVINTATPIAQADASLYQQQSLTNQQARNNANTNNANNAISVGVKGAELDVNQSQFNQSLMQKAKEFDTTSKQAQQQIDNQATQFDKELAQQSSQFALTQTHQMELAKKDVDSKMALANSEGQFKNQIQGSQNISNAWGTMMTTVADIQNNPNLSEETKAALINNNLQSFQSFANFWNKANGGAVDVSDLLAFGMEAAPGGSGSSGGSGSGGSSGGPTRGDGPGGSYIDDGGGSWGYDPNGT